MEDPGSCCCNYCLQNKIPGTVHAAAATINTTDTSVLSRALYIAAINSNNTTTTTAPPATTTTAAATTANIEPLLLCVVVLLLLLLPLLLPLLLQCCYVLFCISITPRPRCCRLMRGSMVIRLRPCIVMGTPPPLPLLVSVDASLPLDGSSFVYEFDSCPLCYGTERDTVLDGGEVGVEFCEMCSGME